MNGSAEGTVIDPCPITGTKFIVLFIGEFGTGHSEMAAKVCSHLGMLYFSSTDALLKLQKLNLTQWEKRAKLLQSMESMIFELYADNDNQYNGIVIDRLGKNVEDLYYFAALMNKNSWFISAVVCCQHCRVSYNFLKSTDAVTCQKLELTQDIILSHKEMLYNTCIWKVLQCPIPEASYLKEMTELLSECNRIPITRALYVIPHFPPSESRFFNLVTDVEHYNAVVTRVYDLLQINRSRFPGRTSGLLLNNEEATRFLSNTKATDMTYVFREMKGGTPYVLFYSSTMGLFFIPRHLRCIYTLNITIFKPKLREFILDGELVCNKTTKSDVFYVHDCLVTQGKSCFHRNWPVRQKYITDCMIPREGAFDILTNRITFLHQRFIDYKAVTHLVQNESIKGLFVQPTDECHIGSDENTLCWYPPKRICLDLRIGKISNGNCAHGPDLERLPQHSGVRVLTLECLDTSQRTATYVPANLSVEVHDPKLKFHVGNIVEVSIDWANKKHCTFQRVRYDRAISDTTGKVELVMSKLPLSEAGFLSFASKLRILHDEDCKTVTYSGNDIVKKLVSMKQMTSSTRVLDVPCKYFLSGTCTAGIRCAYKHQRSETTLSRETSMKCKQCEQPAPGTVDRTDGNFYCYSCWDKYDQQHMNLRS